MDRGGIQAVTPRINNALRHNHDNVPSSAKQVSSCQKSRVKPVPDFAKLHRKWEEGLNTKLAMNKQVKTQKYQKYSKGEGDHVDEFSTVLPENPPEEQVHNRVSIFSTPRQKQRDTMSVYQDYVRHMVSTIKKDISYKVDSPVNISAPATLPKRLPSNRKAHNPQIQKVLTFASPSERKFQRVPSTKSSSPRTPLTRTPKSEQPSKYRSLRVPNKCHTPSATREEVDIHSLDWENLLKPLNLRDIDKENPLASPKRRRSSIILTPSKRTPKQDIRLRGECSPLKDLSPNVPSEEHLSKSQNTQGSDSLLKTMANIQSRQAKLRQRIGDTPRIDRKVKRDVICPPKSPLIRGAICRKEEKISPFLSPSLPTPTPTKPSGSLSLKGNIFTSDSHSLHNKQQRLIAADLYEAALADQEVALFTSKGIIASPASDRPMAPVARILQYGDFQVFID
ncbi:hypothetical protein CAPTEDRAFT_209824 [Capitella teleta]|uniref:Uncharacterized protein n=1 Tax=Capitella teleta TaxID=283909 RepID=R7T452_CAPTE|nr:hypothetical protein CAPTEDRAFT_209824 [Capitella teleta]|eukprot:ELT87618.1 hypothetical protein CAPTEDRAFT_209824 [Capitella teleta]